MCHRRTSWPAFWNASAPGVSLQTSVSEHVGDSSLSINSRPIELWPWNHILVSGWVHHAKWLGKQPGTGNKPTWNQVCQGVWWELFACPNFCLWVQTFAFGLQWKWVQERVFVQHNLGERHLSVSQYWRWNQSQVLFNTKEPRSHLSLTCSLTSGLSQSFLQTSITNGNGWDNMCKAPWTSQKKSSQ